MRGSGQGIGQASPLEGGPVQDIVMPSARLQGKAVTDRTA
jgi:hypothetical protein